MADPAHRGVGGGLPKPDAVNMLDARVPCRDFGVPGLPRSGTVTAERGLVGGPPARARPTLATVLVVANWMDSIAGSPELQQHAEELLALSTEHGFPFHGASALAFRGRLVDCVRASAGRPRAAHAGAGGSTCYRNCSTYGGAAHVARRGLRYARAAGRGTEMPRRGCGDYRDHRGALRRGGVASGARRFAEFRRRSIGAPSSIIIKPSPLPRDRAQSSCNCGRRPASPGSGAIRASARKPVIYSIRSTTGSPKVSMRQT